MYTKSKRYCSMTYETYLLDTRRMYEQEKEKRIYKQEKEMH
jgi:hypothetical protein